MKDRHGDLSIAGLPGLLHLIFLKKDPSSVLDIMKEPIKKRFFFKDGLPVAASSNILNEVLGRLLMQEGVITQQQYQSSLETVLREKKKHGEVLIAMGLLTPETLNEFLALQLKRRLFRLFDWDEGSYRYIKTEEQASAPSRHFHPASLILEGISLGFYPVEKIRSGLDSWLDKKTALSFEGSPYSLTDFRLNLQEKRFAESIDGTKTLSEALDSSDLLRHRAESIALSLIMTGVMKDESGIGAVQEVVLEEEKETHAPEVPVDSKLNAELLFMRAKSAISKREYLSAIATLREITNINPAEGEYWAWLGWAVYNDDPSKIKEAETIIKDSIDLNNDIDSAWHFLGIISLAKGDAEWARKAFKTALAKNPWATEALSELKRLELSLIYRDAPEEVLSFFGFSEDPFSPVPGQMTLTPGQAAALESVARAVRKKSGPVFLEGEAGSGKTTVLLELLRKLSSDKMLSALILRPPVRELELIKEINRGLGCGVGAQAVKEQLLGLGMRVSQNRIQGGSTLIIIDEAHRLTHGCLKLIQYLSRLKAVQLLLSGENSLSETLKAPEFQELAGKISAKAVLTRLTREETVALLDTMLSSAPVNKTPDRPSFSISVEEAEEVFEETGGNPGAIRREAASLLQKAFDDFTAVKEEVPEETPAEKTPEMEEAKEEEPVLEDAFIFLDNEQQGEALPSASQTDESAPWPDETQAQAVSEPEKSVHPVPEPKPVPPPAEAAPAEPKKPVVAPSPVESAVETGGQDREPPVERRRSSLALKLVIMIGAGLIVGSLIGTYILNEPVTQEAPAPAVIEPAQPQPVEAAAPADASLDASGPEGSVQ